MGRLSRADAVRAVAWIAATAAVAAVLYGAVLPVASPRAAVLHVAATAAVFAGAVWVIPPAGR